MKCGDRSRATAVSLNSTKYRDGILLLRSPLSPEFTTILIVVGYELRKYNLSITLLLGLHEIPSKVLHSIESGKTPLTCLSNQGHFVDRNLSSLGSSNPPKQQ